MSPLNAPQTVIVGVGSPWRRDDAAGLEVAARLVGRVPGHVSVHGCTGDLSRLLALWKGATHAIVIDAMRSQRVPGTIHTLAPATSAATTPAWSSTRTFGVAQVLAMAEVLESRPARVDLYGIEVADFGFGEGLSAPVARAVEALAAQLLLYLGTSATLC